MSLINITPYDETYIRVFSSYDIEMELSDFFSFFVPGYRFTPKYKAKMWDGKIRLYNLNTKMIYKGLLPLIEDYAAQNGHDIEYSEPDAFLKQAVNTDALDEWLDDINLSTGGKAIDFRDFQREGVFSAITNERELLISSTGSGKSALIYTIMRWHILNKRKVVLIVPSTSLVEQMYSDFVDYSTLNGWNVEKNCQKLYSGFTKEVTTNCLITTWQSIVGQPKSYFDNFDVVIGDEAHQFKANSLKTIFDKLGNVRFRTGTTGSLDGSKINALTLQGMFGNVNVISTSRKLMDDGILSEIKIKALLLKYSEDVRKEVRGFSYQDEMDFLCGNTKRNNFIKNLATSCKGNTIVLFQYVEKHGKILHKLIEDAAPDKQVFLIYGNTPVDQREEIRRLSERHDNVIIVASYGVFSTGINIKNIHNIILSSPSKSKIRIIQSLGRGTRLNTNKTHFNLFDIGDDLHWKSKKNFTLTHAIERYKLYSEEEFNMKLIEVDL